MASEYDDFSILMYANKLAEAWRMAKTWPQNIVGLDALEFANMFSLVESYYMQSKQRGFKFSEKLQGLLDKQTFDTEDLLTLLLMYQREMTKRGETHARESLRIEKETRAEAGRTPAQGTSAKVKQVIKL